MIKCLLVIILITSKGKNTKEESNMKNSTTKLKITKLFITLLAVLTIGLVAVGCSVKLSSSKKKANTLSPVAFSVLNKNFYDQLSTSAKSLLFSSPESPNTTYSGALISSALSELHDKEGQYPTVQLSIDNRVENFYIIQTDDKNKDGAVSKKDYTYYLSYSQNGDPANTSRARLVLDKNDMLRIVVHPNLSNSTSFSRIIRGRALPSNGTVWKTSPLSSAETITVRKLTFATTSYNSIEPQSAYGYLSYDKNLYDFSLATPSGTEQTTYLEGYFVEGRVVNVTRHLLNKQGTEDSSKAFDYDFQSWTVGSAANQFVSLTQHERTGVTLENFSAPLQTTTFPALSNGINITANSETNAISAWDRDIVQSGSTFKYNNNPTQSTICVRASSTTHKQVFYANYVKINHFTMSGRVFNGDAISLNQTRLEGLSNVVITIHNNKNTTADYNASTDANGNFVVSGLSKGAYLTFAYTGNGSESTGTYDIVTENVVYKFVSSSFSTEPSAEAPDDASKKIYIGATERQAAAPSDIENVSITGSALPDGSNLEVVVSFVDDNGNNISGDGARYEYVKGVTGSVEYYTASGIRCTSEHNHEQNGCTAYTTTTILVSVIPGTNKMVKNYSIATSSNSQLYKRTLKKVDYSTIEINGGYFTWESNHEVVNNEYTIASNSIFVKIGSNWTEFKKVDATMTTPILPYGTIQTEMVLYVSGGTLPENENQTKEVFFFMGGNNNDAAVAGAPTNTAIEANVYTSQMLSNGQPIYLYYSLEKGTDGNLYYVDPVAYQQGTEIITVQNGIEISNFNALRANGTIKQGSQILKNSSFALAAGILRDSYYYYVAPIANTPIPAYVRVENTTMGIQMSSLILCSNNYLANTDSNSAALFVTYNNNTISFSTAGLASTNGNTYFFTLPIGIMNDGNFLSTGNYTLSGTTKDNQSDYYFFTNGAETPTVLAAQGGYIKANSATFASFIAACGGENFIQNDLVYFVAPLSSGASTDNTSSMIPATVEYAYAFLKDNSGKNQSAVSRSEVQMINVFGKTFATSNGFQTINALRPLNGETSYINPTNILNTLSDLNITMPTNTFGSAYNIYIDQTISGSEIQGALGVTYLSGTPYPNPVFRFVVRHPAASATANLKICLDKIYYVEVLGTLAERETSDVVVDFSTFTFRESATNISANQTKYMEKQASVLTKDGLQILTIPVVTKYETTYNLALATVPVEDFATYSGDNNIYYTGSSAAIKKYCSGNMVANKGYILYTTLKTANNNNLYFNTQTGQWFLGTDFISASNNITAELAAQLGGVLSPVSAANKNDYIVWKTSNSEIENVAYFDIHTYDAQILADSGKLVLYSECEDPCIELLNLDETDILDHNNNYDNVVVAGTTSLYRISKDEAKLHKGSTSGYFESTALVLQNSTNATDPYFNVETDAVVAIATPTVKVSSVENYTAGVYYRFKEWRVYKRFNSQVLTEYHDANIRTDGSIIYFYPNENSNSTGYFLLLPVYERMYTVSVGTTTSDGTLNNGGTVSVGIDKQVQNATHNTNETAYYYTPQETQTHIIKSLTNDFVVSIQNEITYYISGNEIYYVVNGVAKSKNGIEKSTSEFNGDQGPRTVEVSNNRNIYTFVDSDLGTVQLSTSVQFAAMKPKYFVVDKYLRSITIDDTNYTNYIDTEGYISVDGRKIAQIVSTTTTFFEPHSSMSNSQIQSTDSSNNTSISPTTWLIDRHTTVTLVAMPNTGYRFDSWYLVVYDEETGSLLRSSLAAFNASQHYYDSISLPTRIVLLENQKYYRYYIVENSNGKFEMTKVQENSRTQGDYVLFGGRLYYSDSVVAGNMLTSLTPYSNATGVNYDNFIEYFNYQTDVLIVDKTNNTYQAGAMNGTKYVTRILPYSETKNAVHYVETANLTETIYTIKDENGLETTGANGLLSSYRGTEVFHGVTDANNGYFFLGQSTQNASTLVPTRVVSRTQVVTIEFLDGANYICIDGMPYHELGATDIDKFAHFEGEGGKIIGNLKYLIFDYEQPTHETYTVTHESTGQYTITRYYLYVTNSVYSKEVFDYNESAQTYVEHNHEMSYSQRDGNSVENNSNWQTLHALQYPVVDFLLNQISAISNRTGEQMELSKTATKNENTYTFIFNVDGTEYAIKFNHNQLSFKNGTNGVLSGATGEVYKTSNPTASHAVHFVFGTKTTVACEDVIVATISGMELSGNNLTLNLMADSYELSSTIVYETNGLFYRTRLPGEIEVEGNTVTINTLGKNEFIVANYIEYHHVLTQTETDSDDATVQIAGMFYFGENAVRTSNGQVISGDLDVNALSLNMATNADFFGEYGVFGYNDGTTTKTLTAAEVGANYTKSDGVSNALIEALKNGTTYALPNGKAIPLASSQNRWLNFDTGSSLIVVVRTSSGTSLKSASLGLENLGNLKFLLCPTEKALSNTQIPYLFYVIQIDFNHNLNNIYLEALEHPNNKALLLKNVSTNVVYKNGSDYYFNKLINQTNENGVVVTPAPSDSNYATYQNKLTDAQKAYVAKVTTVSNGKSFDHYYFVPSGNLADSAVPEGAVWVNTAASAAKNPIAISYYDRIKNSTTESNAVEIKNLINRDAKITEQGTKERYLKINTGRPGNYLNLSSIPLYDFNVFAMTLNSDSSSSDLTKSETFTNYSPSSAVIKMGATTTLWAAGGRQTNNGHLMVVGLNSTSTTQTIAGQTFYQCSQIDESNYLTDGLMQPLVLCIDTMLTLGAPTTVGTSYRFAGWYQIKQTGTNANGTPIWGNPVFLGLTENVSPVVADANTYVVAVYKQVVDISISFNNTQIEFESNMPTDSKGNNLVAVNGTTTTLSGSFDYDAAWQLSLTAAPGYRLNNITEDSNIKYTFSGHLTDTQHVTLLAKNGNINDGGTYTINAIQTTTAVVRISNYNINAKADHQIVITSGGNTFFSSSWLSNDTSLWDNFDLSGQAAAAEDKTGNYATIFYNSESNELIVVFICDINDVVTLVHEVLPGSPHTPSNRTEFIGWFKNGNTTESSSFTLEDSAVEFSATISQIVSMSYELLVLDGDQTITNSLKTALEGNFSLTYSNGKRYSYGASTYTEEYDPNQQLSHSSTLDMFNTFFFDYQALLSLNLNITKIQDVSGQKIMFLGYGTKDIGGNINTSELVNNVALGQTASSSGTTVLVFALASEIQTSTVARPDSGTSCNFELNQTNNIATQADATYFAHTVDATFVVRNLAATDGFAIIECFEVTIGTQELIIVGTEGTLEFNNGKTITYSAAADLSTLSISYTGPETTISIVAITNTGDIIS